MFFSSAIISFGRHRQCAHVLYPIKGRRMMAVVEMDRSTVLYTGIYRLGTLYAQYGTIERSIFSSNSSQVISELTTPVILKN